MADETKEQRVQSEDEKTYARLDQPQLRAGEADPRDDQKPSSIRGEE
jgi:hypothetical protein